MRRSRRRSHEFLPRPGTALSAAIAAAFVLLLPASPSARDLTVSPRGLNPYTTIAAAIEAASEGDTISLDDGVYRGSGNRDLGVSKRLTIRSASGNPSSCTIDCEGSAGEPHRAFEICCGSARESIIQGLTITGGNTGAWDTPGGGAILLNYLEGGATTGPIIRDCVFSLNSTEEFGGAIAAWNMPVTIEGCRFDGNDAWSGGAIAIQTRAATITACVFTDNSAYHGGAVSIAFCDQALIEGCTFVDNSAWEGGALSNGLSETIIRTSTIARNSATRGAVAVIGAPSLEIESSIIANSPDGESIYFESAGSATLRCCDLYGNKTGDWVAGIANQLGVDGNISSDPLLCDPANGQFALASNSPCAAPNNPGCGQIGAWGVGCEETPVVRVSWGEVRALFR